MILGVSRNSSKRQTRGCERIEEHWRSSAERFGDRVALVDPYHDPPTNMTYKQVEQDIVNFAEDLRVIGIKPCEKLALFADNSCRWLIADQGGLHSDNNRSLIVNLTSAVLFYYN